MHAIRPFRHPRLWLCSWWLGVLAMVVVCLMPPPPLPPLPSDSDKVEHFLGYLLLQAGAVQVFATRRAWCVAALGLVALGIGIEIAQGAFTVTRSADPFDALADALGVLAGLATMWLPQRDLLLRLDSRLETRRR